MSTMPSLFPLTDPIVIVALVACLILVIPFVMQKLRMPALVGLLLAGAILGPNALHVLERDQSFILLGSVGLIFIMFTAALEVDLEVFKKFGLHAIVFGILTFGLPLAAAAPVAIYVLGYAFLPGILLASIFSSHTLLAYPMASRLGIARNRAVTTAIGGTMIADTSALLVLAVVVGVKAEGEVTETFWWRLGASIFVYVALVFLGLPRLGRWLFRHAGKDGNVQFAFVLASVFVCAALSHLAGLEPIVGAFLAGLALHRLIPHNGTLMNRITFAGEAIFVPFFLISVGMLLDASVLITGFETWIIIIYMTGMVLATKFLAAEATRLLLRFDKAEARVVFSLTLAQAAATLAVVQVGFNIGLFDKTVVNGSIVMILVTCTVAPMIMARYGPDVAAREAAAEAVAGLRPKQRILVGVRDLASARPLIELALLLRDGTQRQPLYLVHAARDDDQTRDNMGRAEKVLLDAVSLCSSADVPAEISTTIDHSLGGALCRSTKELQGSHLLLDWSFDAPSSKSVLGSTVDELLRKNGSTIVLLRPRHTLSTTQNILLAIPPLAFDEATLSAAVSTVKRLARQLGAPVEVLAEAKTWKETKDVLQQARPSAKVKHNTLESWASLRQALADRISPSDILVLIGHREASSELARTGIEVAKRFPDATIALVHGAATCARPVEQVPTLDAFAEAVT